MLLEVIKNKGVKKFVLWLTTIVIILSVAITSFCLFIFQGYIDVLGIVIAIVAPAIILPIPAALLFMTLLKLEVAETKLKKRNRELEKALSNVEKLSGLLPICTNCKKIRDDKGYWNEVEVYIRDYSEVDFSHSICPDCIKALYPNYKKACH